MKARAAVKQVSFATTGRENDMILAIVARAVAAKLIRNTPSERQTLEMDIAATHCNGCRLDFVKWLKFDAFSFAHDVYGIDRHVSRETGELTDCFVPRCAKPSRRR